MFYSDDNYIDCPQKKSKILPKRIFLLIIHVFSISFCIVIFWFNITSACWDESTPKPINANPGTPNPHANTSGHRVARIHGATVILAPQGNADYTFRSTDNGTTWDQIDTDGTYSGTLISGSNSVFYHFYRTSNSIEMIKFRYDQNPPLPVTIYSNPEIGETDTGAYRSIDATVNADGNLFVTLHWGNPDHIYLLCSADDGLSWDGPFQVSSGGGHSWYYPRLTVTPDNTLICVYDNFPGSDPHTIVFASSSDSGQNWVHNFVSTEITYNPTPLVRTDSEVFIFAQSGESSHKGLVYNFSSNSGKSWNGWILIDETCGYADPSAALGSDNQTIYVAYRSSNNTGISNGSCGDRSRFRLAVSRDLGKTWSFPDDYYEADRTGTRNHIRYQTWFNYGGPLEWIWMQYENEDTVNESRKTYYDHCLDKFIYNIQSAVRGDINLDGKVNLIDAILSMQICSGTVNHSANAHADTNNDGQIGMHETIYGLKISADLDNN